MEFLRFLEKLRTPFFDFIFSLITLLGGEVIFMAVAVFVLWCVNKKTGYYILCIGFLGTVINQVLKLAFRIPRPWVKDPNFTIVEAARSAATGYSFPSGHTQNAVGTFGGLAYCSTKKWQKFVLIIIAVLIAFSRMYLGVHTPLDVGVSLLVAVALIFILKVVFDGIDKNPSRMYILLGVMLVLSFAYIIYVLYFPFKDIDEANYLSGLGNAYTLFGATVGVIFGHLIEEKYIKFDTSAVWWAQALKAILGLGIIVLMKSLLKSVLYSIFGGSLATNAVRYFIIVMFAACVWPLTFRFFAKLGKRKPKAE